jgi:hypothetical protein
MSQEFLSQSIKQFRQYKSLADRSIATLTDDQLNYSQHADSNSVSVIIRHMAGNMLSRWTDIFTTDGEKPDRQRDAEFEPSHASRQQLLDFWEKGWNRLFETLEPLRDNDLERIIYIRQEPHSVMAAILRQLTHYSYHVGQVVFIAKLFSNDDWVSLSIPRKK